jgi:hypothetical protein
MMEYKVLNERDQEILEQYVNEHLARGWVPCGGISVCSWFETWENTRKGNTESETYTRYAQAMTRNLVPGATT